MLGTDVQVIDLITPYLDNDTILSINRVCKRWTPKRSIVVKRKYERFVMVGLESKKLKLISNEVKQLKKLECFDLGSNDLTSIPKEIGQLQKL